MFLPLETVKATLREVALVGAHQTEAYLWLSLSDISAIRGGGQAMYGAPQFVEYARNMGEEALSGVEPGNSSMLNRGYFW